jgi:hypothetical protein
MNEYKAGFPLGGIFHAEPNFSLSFLTSPPIAYRREDGCETH